MFSSIKAFLLNRDYTLGYKWHLISLMLIAGTLPFTIGLNNVAIGLLLLNWLASGNYHERLKKAFRDKFFLLFAAVFFVQLIGLAYTENLEDGFGKIETKAGLVLLPLVLFSSHRLRLEHIHLIVAAFIASCTLLSAYGFVTVARYYEAHESAAGLTEFIDTALYLHHAYSGMFIVFAAAASCYLVVYGNLKKFLQVILVVVALFLYSFLIVLAARTAVFASFLLFFIFFIYSLIVSRKKKYYIAAALACLVLVLIVLGLPNTRTKIEEFNTLKGVHNPMTPRLIKWKCCFKILEGQNAWGWGVGTGDVQDHLQICYTEEKFWGDQYLLNAHNEFLEEMVRHGIPGAFLLVISLLYPLWLAIRHNKKLYTVFLVVFVMCSFTESTLSRQKGVVFYALFNAVFAFSYLSSSPDLSRQKEKEATQFIKRVG